MDAPLINSIPKEEKVEDAVVVTAEAIEVEEGAMEVIPATEKAEAVEEEVVVDVIIITNHIVKKVNGDHVLIIYQTKNGTIMLSGNTVPVIKYHCKDEIVYRCKKQQKVMSSTTKEFFLFP